MTSPLRSGSEAQPPSRRPRWPLVVAVVVAVLAAVVIFVVARDDDEAAPPPPTTSSSTSTSTSGSTVTTPSFDADVVVFPDATTDSSYDDPVAVARAFAVELLGFVDPVVGEYVAGDSRSGEVEIRPTADGPVTTALVRQRAPNDDWWVLGSVTPNIVVTEPAALAEITSPVRLRGRSTAFEANVSVVIRQDGSARPVGEGYVTGGSMGEMGPFDSTLPYAAPSADAGVLILFTQSMEDGRTWEATVLRVAFGDASSCGGLPAPPMPGADEMALEVFYSCGDAHAGVTGVTRVVPRTTAVLRVSLEQLLAGPTDAERSAGFSSWFSGDTAGMLRGVNLTDGHAVVDFDDLRPVIPNASASAGSQMLLEQLDATVFQHDQVRTVEYRLEGDCEAFNEWLQVGGCDPRRRP